MFSHSSNANNSRGSRKSTFFNSGIEALEADYEFKEELGRGTFAIARKAVDKHDGSTWAVKCIEKSRLEKEEEAALRLEVAILESVDHPAIVHMRQVYDTPKTFFMVMELMTGGELFERIYNKGRYTEPEAAAVIARVADALQYCHARGIVHRDLKLENLLLTDSSESAEVKIADFGLAKLISQSQAMATACGTPGYVAPEILSQKGYTEKVDCWSLGVILYIMLCGFPPFYDENNAVLFQTIRAGDFGFPSPYWDDISEEAKDLVRKLLRVDPKDRLSAAEVLEHPWIQSAEKGRALEAAAARLKRLTLPRGALSSDVMSSIAASGEK